MKVVVYDSQSCQECEVDMLTLQTSQGVVSLKKGHEPTIWRILPGPIVGHKSQEKVFERQTFGGIALVDEDGVNLSIDHRDLFNF